MKQLLIIIFVSVANHSIAQIFSEKTSNGFIFNGVENSKAVFVDIDNDEDEDLLYSSIFYKNNAEEGFSSFFSFRGASNNVVAFGDYNRDGFADVFLGNTLYRNDGGTGFTSVFTFAGNTNAVSFSDFNNDALPDILLTGTNTSILYRNNNESFIHEQIFSGGTNITHGDTDADGDLDIVIDKSSVLYSLFYENRNTGFTSVFENIFAKTTTGTPNLIDFDADGDLDIFVSNTLYKNSGTSFSISAAISISNLTNYESSWADMDNDGYADLVISGTENTIPIPTFVLKIYKNHRIFFTENTSISHITKHALSDFDGDGDMDIFSPEAGLFYENTVLVPNNPPNIPNNLNVIFLQTGELRLTWASVSDPETPSSGLHYEIYFSLYPSRESVDASVLTHNTFYKIYSFGAGVYHWKVRAVDASKNKSNWSEEQIYITNRADEATEITAQSFVANVQVNPDVLAYRLDVARDRNFTQFLLQNFPIFSASKQITSLTPNTSYYYRVQTSTLKGNSDYSPSIKVTTSQQTRTASFTTTTIPSLTLKNGSTRFADYDNDGDMDFFVNGTTGTTTNASFLLLQNNNAVLGSANSIANAYSNHTIFADYNNDNRGDAFVGAKLYQNTAPTFSQIAFSFPNIPIGSSNFVDIDNDGYRDVFITGYDYSSSQGVSKLFKNNKTSFAEVFSLSIPNVSNSSSAFGDIDNDGDADALISGFDGSARITKLYENQNGQFVVIPATNFIGIQNGSVDLVDFNNDGYLDVCITGEYDYSQVIGSASYVGETRWSMYHLMDNGDSFSSSSLVRGELSVTKLYYNLGNKRFAEFSAHSISGSLYSKPAFADIDNDGDIDILFVGSFVKASGISNYFTFYNTPSNTNSYLTLNGLYAIWGSPSTFFSYTTYQMGFKVYINNGNSFTEDFSDRFSDCYDWDNFSISGSVGDYNNDGRIDIGAVAYIDALRSSSSTRLYEKDYHRKDGFMNTYFNRIYTNTISRVNTPPAPPKQSASYTYGAGKIVFIWENASDTQIPEENNRSLYNGLNYNISVGTNANKNLICSSHALTNGNRTLPQRGDLQGNVYKLENIPNGNYVWSIQAIDQGFLGSPFLSEQTIEITSKLQTQSLAFPAIPDKTFLDAPFTPSATATSGLPASFLSTNPNVATTNGQVITIVGRGETNIIAFQIGNTQYYGAYPVTRLLRVNRARQTLSFTNNPVQTVGVPFQFDISSNSTNSASIYNASMSFLGIHNNGRLAFSVNTTGTFTLLARKTELTLDYLPSDTISQTFTIKAPQSLTFFKPLPKTYGDPAFVLTARSSASLPIVFSSNNTLINISNNTVEIHGVGTVTITAFVNESHPHYFPANFVTQIFTIKKARQSITFDLPLSKTFGNIDSIIVLSATASSSLPVSFRFSGQSVIANGNTLTIKRAGVFFIEALQSGNANYEAASIIRYLTIINKNKIPQTITFTSIPNDTLSSEEDIISVSLNASASSSLPIKYVFGTSTDSLATDSFTVRLPGIYTITAFQNGDTTFNPAPPLSQTCTVKRSQSIFFSPIPQKNYKSTPFFPNAHSTSGLEIQFSLSNDSVISLAQDNVISIRNVGTASLKATQIGDDEYYAADSVTRIVTVIKTDQSFVFHPIDSKIYEDPPILLPSTTHAGLKIMYSISSDLIQIDEDTLKILAGGGIVKITAYNTGNHFYNPLAPVSQTFSISKAMQSIHFPSIENKVFGDAPIIFDSVSNKNRPVIYASSNTNVFSINNYIASINRAGSITLSAMVPGNAQYLEVSQTQTIRVTSAPQIVIFRELPLTDVGYGAFVLNATSTNTLPIFYTSSNPHIASITGNTVALHTFGNVSITAFQPALENYYLASNQETRLLIIQDRTAVENTIHFPLAEVQYRGDTVLLEASSSKQIPVSFAIVQNDNGNRNGAGRYIVYFDASSHKITLLDTGTFQIRAYTEPSLNKAERVNPAVLIKTIQVKNSYNIAGRVLGAENEVVAGFVILTNPDTKETRRTELSNGYFSFKNVPSEWTFYLQAFPKGTILNSYYPTYYGIKQGILWTDADLVILQSPRGDLNWNFRRKPKSRIETGNGTIIGKVIVDTTENLNRILYGNFFGAGLPYPYANIFLKSTTDSILINDISRTNGEFYFNKLPAGYYKITVDVPGTKLKYINDSVFLPNEVNTLYITFIIGQDNRIELLRYLAKIHQTITFPPIYKDYGDEPFPILATATSGLPLTFQSSSSLVHIENGIVTIRRAGTCIITAFQSGNEYYNPSIPTSQDMIVQKAYQIITIQANVINDAHKFSERRVVIKTTISSGLPVELTFSEPSITQRGDTLFARGIAFFKMTAIQSGNENYHPEQTSQDIIIYPNAIVVENPHIKIFPNPTDNYITILWDKTQHVSSIQLYDLSGKSHKLEIKNYELEGKYELELKPFPAGEYILIIYGENCIGKPECLSILKTEKIIKN